MVKSVQNQELYLRYDNSSEYKARYSFLESTALLIIRFN